ncbi:hypothetical protein DP939_09305 [Spongiactinospora rosea]|uniref:Uncharacterized protein n=2 Tax=Spongiactinospora rosea TaxID=2248750 RepID=A0A366M1C8_9ACTN|nr:hypothetical protein DP939_09305 [Spongiactinospora rosea]
MVQIFTGLREGDPARNDDLDLVVQLMTDLWDSQIPARAFRKHAASLEGFQELEPSEEPATKTAEIFSFYSVLVLRYAALYRAGAGAEEALRCAHSCLTAMGQLDQNLPTADFFSQEADSQVRSAPWPALDESGSQALSQLRETDRVAGRERLAAVRRVILR